MERENNTMNVFVIITLTLICLVALAWRWLKKPVLARTWPAPRVRTGPKPKFTVPFKNGRRRPNRWRAGATARNTPANKE
jgi:hypothetical protein